MDNNILVALITAGLPIIGTVITVFSANKKQSDEMDKKMAVKDAALDVKLKYIDGQLAEHNKYAKLYHETIPVIQAHLETIDEKLEYILNRKERST